MPNSITIEKCAYFNKQSSNVNSHTRACTLSMTNQRKRTFPSFIPLNGNLYIQGLYFPSCVCVCVCAVCQCCQLAYSVVKKN